MSSAEDKPVTIVISDLHLGGGPDDPGDDHVYQGSQLIRFLREVREREEAAFGPGGVELFINGDFLEFAQVAPEVYSLRSTKYWCSEDESRLKLKKITDGHKDIFDELREFQKDGNRVTVSAGNHDVDLYWHGVREDLAKAAGPVEIAAEEEWFYRYGRGLAISHGHQIDPANRFKKWHDPVYVDDQNVPRLEMCPGTLFMVKLVNELEADGYRFIDNIKPVTALRPILRKADKGRYRAAAWMLLKFALMHPLISLGGRRESPHDIFVRFSQSMLADKPFAEDVARLYCETYGVVLTTQEVRERLATEEALFDFMYEAMSLHPPEKWAEVFDGFRGESVTLSIQPAAAGPAGSATTLHAGWSHISVDKEALRSAARRQFLKGSRVVVMGHTHQPDELREGANFYFNPGSWIRYADIESIPNLTLEHLKNEAAYPYQLNYVRVEGGPEGVRRAEMLLFEEEAGSVGKDVPGSPPPQT